MNHPQRHQDHPDKDYDSLANTHAFLRDAAAEIILTKQYYDSVVTTLAFLRDADIFGRFLTYE
jgi:hypothetical protein